MIRNSRYIGIVGTCSVLFGLMSCSGEAYPNDSADESVKKNIDTVFFNRTNSRDIYIFDSVIRSVSSTKYILELNHKNTNLHGAEFKKYVPSFSEGAESLEEWIEFDKLNRPNSMHFATLKFDSNSSNNVLVIEGRLHSTLQYDQLAILVGRDSIVWYADEIKGTSFRIELKKPESPYKELNVQFVILIREGSNNSVALQYIHKRYFLENGNFKEVLYNPAEEPKTYFKAIETLVRDFL